MPRRANNKRRIRLSPKLPKRKAVDIYPREVLQIGRNEPCPCGSGIKYKHCHEAAGESFLRRVAKKRAQEERTRLTGAPVPWYKRLFTKV